MPVRKIRSYILRAMGLTSGVTSFFLGGGERGEKAWDKLKVSATPSPHFIFNEVKVNTYHFRQN